MSIIVALAVAPVVAFAQTIPTSELPGRQQLRFQQTMSPLATPGGAMIALPSTGLPAGAAATRLRIADIVVDGSTVYSQEALKPLYSYLIGKDVTVASIYEAAAKITAKYGADGYVLSRVIVPPQQLNPKGAIVHLQVLEGYFDKVVWPDGLSKYRDLFSGYSAKITAERPANIHTVERYILLAGDLPGLSFSTSINASKDQSGASTLVVQMVEKSVDAEAQIDNRGTAARGPIEYSASVTANNWLKAHEAFTLSYAGAFPLHTLQYLSGGYRQVLTSEGLTVFADASHSWGRPATAPLEALQYRTTSTNFDVGLSYPVIRGREKNLTVSGLAFVANDDADTLGAPFNRDRLRGVRLKLDGDFSDSFLATSQFNATLSHGFLGYGSTHNGDVLASRLVGRVDFTKVEASISRQQPLAAGFSLYGSLYGQYAFTPLLTPEQCGYGGATFGRAFDPSELLGDRCVFALGELRFDAPRLAPQISKSQLYAFADYGRLFTMDAASGTTANVEGASLGGGLRLDFVEKFKTDLQIARAVDGPRQGWRFFFTASAHY